MFVRVLWLAGLAIVGTATWSGMPYYLTPVDERPFSPLHDLYSSTGLIGHGFGIVGSLLVVVGVILYTARKRLPFLSRVGKLRDWLHFHIFLCLVGPFLVLLHTTFRFGGLVAISFWSMAAVVSSGVFGRYVYSWIPKTISGGFVGAEETRARMEELLREAESSSALTAEDLSAIARGRRAPGSSGASGEAPPIGTERRRRGREPGILRAALEAMGFRMGRRRRLARFDRELGAVGVAEPLRRSVIPLLEEEARIEQQLRILRPFQRAFRYWHAFHLPLALVMFLVLGVHVAVALAFGYTWIF